MHFNVGLFFLGKHLQYIRAFPFDHRIPGDFHTELQDVVNKADVPPDDHFQQLSSSGDTMYRVQITGSTFTALQKTSKALPMVRHLHV